ncbi:glutamate decarboxylase [Tanacetum coccineum]
MNIPAPFRAALSTPPLPHSAPAPLPPPPPVDKHSILGHLSSGESEFESSDEVISKFKALMSEDSNDLDSHSYLLDDNIGFAGRNLQRYFEVELKEVKLSEGYYVMKPEMVDENTICVAAILVLTLNGELEDERKEKVGERIAALQQLL